ncbi:MAG: hypothetical protein E7453_06405 [Ruminococcaceae bacterium]|nr:hypothetical protein [Oscillospiraceae bacterium]
MKKREKKADKKAFPKIWILVAVAAVLFVWAVLITFDFLPSGDPVILDPAEIAYREYLSHYTYPETDDFLYIYGVGDIGIIKDGKLGSGRYSSREWALHALGYDKPDDKERVTVEEVSKDGNFLSVTRNQMTANFVDAKVSLTQTKTIGAAAGELLFLFYNDGLELAAVTVPRASIANASAPVTVSLRSVKTGVYGYELNATNVSGKVDITFLAPRGLSGVQVSPGEASYDRMMGKCTVENVNLGKFSVSYSGVEEVFPIVSEFESTLEYAKAYTYRVGNGNVIPLGVLFKPSGSVPIGPVNVQFRNLDSSQKVSAKYTSSYFPSDWAKGGIRFSGTGFIEVNINGYKLVVEVVDGKNILKDGDIVSANGENVVLLSDITLESSGQLTVSGGYALYGNGFTITDKRTNTTGEVGAIHMTGGVLDNVRLIGYKSFNPTALANDTGRAPALSVVGEANIYNSYIYGGRSPILARSGGAAVYMENVTLDGGARANMEVASSNLILKNCVTTADTRGGLKGIGILITTTDSKLRLEGTFVQSNWLQMADLPSAYSAMLADVYNNRSHAFKYGDAKYVNTGIFFFSESVNFTKEQAQSQLTDNTENKYGFVAKSAAGYSALCYMPKSAMGADTFFAPAYVNSGNYPNAPKVSFDFKSKNYEGKEYGSNQYCVYNPLGYVDISFEKGGKKVWNTDILTVTKFGKKIAPTVTMDGVDYTGKSITFTKAGEYTVVYTYQDTYNCRIPGELYDAVYTNELTVKVTVVDPNVKTYHPTFTYTDGTPAKQVMANDKVYVMPGVSGTSDKIGSTVVDGKTIYYPIVKVSGSDSAGKPYESGKIYCFSPAFTAINIKDYDKNSGKLLYTYDKSTQSWPHNISGSTKVSQGDYFGYGSVSPYTGATGDTYNVCQYNSIYGLSFVSSQIEREVKETTRLVEFYFVGNDGVTYYYYIQYDQAAVAYESCVTPDTLVTLADGTQKEIQHVTYDDQLLVWNFYEGKYDVMPASIVMNHGYGKHTVVTLNFADGTSVNTINGHGFFDANERKYVVLGSDNAADYIGHSFVKTDGNGYSTTKLHSYDIKTEYTESWSILTAGQYNCILEGMWTLTPAEIPGSPDYLMPFEVGADMKYDAEKLQADIDKYGLYTYADFAQYMTEEQFDALGLSTWRVAVGKGYITWEDILQLIEIHIG